jgi:WD40 repeat protein
MTRNAKIGDQEATVQALIDSPHGREWVERLAETFHEPNSRSRVVEDVRDWVKEKVESGSGNLSEIQGRFLSEAIRRASSSASMPEAANEEYEDLEDLVIDQFPQPIALSFRRFIEEREPTAKFGCLLDTFEVIVHLFLTISCSAYLRTQLGDERLNRLILEKLFKPKWSFGDLAELLRWLTREDAPWISEFCPQLRSYLFDERGRPTESGRVLTSVVQDRNALWGHQTGRDSKLYHRILPAYETKLFAELHKLSWLREMTLLRPREIDAQTGRVLRADIFKGERIRRNRSAGFEATMARAEVEGGLRPDEELILLNAMGQPLVLAPLACFVLQIRQSAVGFLLERRWQGSERGGRLSNARYVAYDSDVDKVDASRELVSALERQVELLQAHTRDSPAAPAGTLDRSGLLLPEVTAEARGHLKGFVGRGDSLGQIEEWIASGGEDYLLITAGPGEGKSALMSALSSRVPLSALHMVKSHPDPLRFLPALIARTAELGSLDFGAADVGGSIDDLRNSLVRKLEELAAARGHAVLLIDGLDELPDHRPAFLPASLPPGVRAVLTCRPNSTLVASLRNSLRSMMEQSLPSLTLEDFRGLVRSSLSSDSAAFDVLGLSQLFRDLHGNALLLRRAAEEISRRCAGGQAVTAEDLDSLPRSLRGLFGVIYDEVAEKPRPSAVGRQKACLVKVLSVAFEPLRIADLAAISGLAGEPMDMDACRDRCAEISQYLVDFGDGRVRPWHQGLSDFVQAEVLGESGLRAIHSAFCDWIAGEPWSDYGMRWRVSHQVQAGRAEELPDILLDPKYLSEKVGRGMAVEAMSDFDEATKQVGGESSGHLALVRDCIRSQLAELSRRPQASYQAFWNLLHWYDAPVLSEHFAVPEGEVPTWEKPGPKVSDWMDSWPRPETPWLEACLPPARGLGSGLRSVLKGVDPRSRMAFCGGGNAILAVGPEGWQRIAWRSSKSNHGETRTLIGPVESCGRVAEAVLGEDSAVVAIRFVDSVEGLEVGRVECDPPVEFPHGADLDGGGIRPFFHWAIDCSGSYFATGGKTLRVFATDPWRLLFEAECEPGREPEVMWWEAGCVSSHGGALVAQRQPYYWPVVLISPNSGERRDLPKGAWPSRCTFSRDGGKLAIPHEAGVRLMWLQGEDAGKETNLDDGHIDGCAFSSDGRSLASCGSTVRVWDVQSGRKIAQLDGHSGRFGVSGVAFSEDGTWLASLGSDALAIWNLEEAATPLLPRASRDPRNQIVDLAISPDEATLAVKLGGALEGSEDVELWDLKSSQRIRVVPGTCGGHWSDSVRWAGTRYLLERGHAGRVTIHDLADQRIVFTDVCQGSVGDDCWGYFPLGISPCANRVALPSSPSRGAAVICIATGEVERLLETIDDSIANFSWSEDGRSLVAGGRGQVALFDPESGERGWSVPGLSAERVYLAALSADGSRLAVVGAERTSLWDVAARQQLWTFPYELPFERYVLGVPRFSLEGDSRLLVHHSQGPYSETWIHDTSSGVLVRTIEGATDVGALAAGYDWLPIGGDIETAVENGEGAAIAWAPPMELVRVSRCRSILAGAHGSQLYLYRLHRGEAEKLPSRL